MKILVLLVCCLTLAFAHRRKHSPLKFAACKARLLNIETGIVVRNKDWKGKQFVNIVTKSEPKCTCLWSSRWTELDTSTQPPFVIFHQKFHWKFGSGKGYAKLSELYEVTPDHYVYQYSYGKDEAAKVHVKWLKLLPGVLEIQYMCSDDFMFAENIKDFVVVMTPSAKFSKAVSVLTKTILQRDRFKLKNLYMVPNCECSSKKSERAKILKSNKPGFNKTEPPHTL
ncbi:uncharacterized protein LOC128987185 isoform X2 [Macrosteles quadrilineatus]|uniref:uncharacterized protein LOC128987185 isoform X2 n=1 Tax=Macrosteles quadrilineatus TaxID=74068 RepID=UPI0023E1662E|nr:uncharacterized protein LOC128987185 isoform X2 [Macrosteles quadrilineatus]